MFTIVKCLTRGCPEFLVKKKVTLQYLGQDLFLNSQIMCGGCGCNMWTEILDRVGKEATRKQTV